MNQDFTARAEKQQSRAVESYENLRGILIIGTCFASASVKISAKIWGVSIAPLVPFPTALKRTDWQIYNGLGSDINLF